MSAGATKLVIDKGQTVLFEALPDSAIALDGYVQGPYIDAARRRFSFDHHAGCIRHATLSTCEMTLDAIRVGLMPSDLTIYVNDLDADTILSVWLLMRPDAVRSRAVIDVVRAAGRRDALGPASGSALAPALLWALAPMRSQAPILRSLDEAAWHVIAQACCERLDRWHAAGAPEASDEFEPPKEFHPAIETLHQGVGWRLVRGDGVGALEQLYATGDLAGVIVRDLIDGTVEYTIGKASEFVDRFDVPRLLGALRDAERSVNPAQLDATSWGGGTTIGGSPRNADGGGSRLAFEDVVRVVEATLART